MRRWRLTRDNFTSPYTAKFNLSRSHELSQFRSVLGGASCTCCCYSSFAFLLEMAFGQDYWIFGVLTTRCCMLPLLLLLLRMLVDGTNVRIVELRTGS